ncbi:hypothetical protein ACTQV0_11700 [Selenomonas montiformis]
MDKTKRLRQEHKLLPQPFFVPDLFFRSDRSYLMPSAHTMRGMERVAV